MASGFMRKQERMELDILADWKQRFFVAVLKLKAKWESFGRLAFLFRGSPQNALTGLVVVVSLLSLSSLFVLKRARSRPLMAGLSLDLIRQPALPEFW